jgi:chromosome segregation ATPase
MIQKIKDLMNIQNQITEISDKFNQNSKHVQELIETINNLRKEIDSLKESQNSLVLKFKQDTDAVKESKEELRKEVNDFKLIKSRLEIKLVEALHEELKNELSPRFDRLERHIKDFENLGLQVGVIANRVTNLSGELQKFTDISQNIKKEDFELNRFANQLRAMSNEKLDLMKRLDSMERLVAKVRRSN